MDKVSQSPKETLFPEDSRSGRHATYEDHGKWKTVVEYLPSHSQPTPQMPKNVKVFESRDEMLLYEQRERANAKKDLRDEERYRGFEDSLVSRVKGFALRFFYWVRAIGKPLDGRYLYDQHLLKQPSTLAQANYSAKEVRDFKVQLSLNPKVREKIKFEAKDGWKLWSSSTWHKNGLQSYAFEEDGETKVLHDTVSSSNDRNSSKISMMRRIDDAHNRSVAYTGRPDTQEKAQEQVEFIFKNELAKGSRGKGIKRNNDGSFELTYVVNNLMSPNTLLGGKTGLTYLAGLDERKAILREMEVLQQLSGQTIIIDGKKVKIKPIYFNQGFNWMNNFGKTSLQKSINTVGYTPFFNYALEVAKDNQFNEEKRGIVFQSIAQLKQGGLSAEEEFFLRDLVAKLVGLPVVVHCKSSIDRTSLAVAMSTALQGWLNLGLEIPEKPQELLKNENFKEIFMANLMSSHQVSRVSRAAEGIVKNVEQPSQILGFAWGKSALVRNPIVMNLVPDRYKKKRELTKMQILGYTIAVIASLIFTFGTTLPFLYRSYDSKELDFESKQINGRSLVKPGGLKTWYNEGQKPKKLKVRD